MSSSAQGPTLLIFTEDPGAANAVVGLPSRLAAHGVKAHVVATGAAVAFLAARGERFDVLRDGESAASLVDRVKPSAVFVGTAESPDTLGLAIIAEAKSRGITSVGFVDAYTNAPFRWCGHTSDPLAYCPDHLLVSDPPTEAAFIALGVAPERVRVCGHPQLDAILARAADLAKEDRQALRERLFPGLAKHASQGKRVIVFCGERSTAGSDDAVMDAQFQRSSDYTLNGRGDSNARTQIVAEELLDAVATLPQRPFMVLRYHPKNVDADFGALIDEFDVTSVGGSAVDVLFAADLVVGMTSVILPETSALGRPTLSVVPRELERAWLPFASQTITPCVATRSALREFLSDWAAVSSTERRAAPIVASRLGAMDRLCQLVVELTR